MNRDVFLAIVIYGGWIIPTMLFGSLIKIVKLIKSYDENKALKVFLIQFIPLLIISIYVLYIYSKAIKF